MSDDKDVVTIGCGAGGGTVAQFARKTDRVSSVTVFEKGKYSQYSKCGLSYVISGDISDFHDLIESNPDLYVEVRDNEGRKLYSSRKSIRFEAGRREVFNIKIRKK